MYFFIYGGLGNQLFQYATASEIINLTKRKLRIIDMTNFFGRRNVRWELGHFGFEPHRCSYLFKVFLFLVSRFSSILKRYIKFFQIYSFDEQDFINCLGNITNNVYIFSGYWQGENFFATTGSKTLASILVKRESVLKKKFHIPKLDSLAVHIRRGDYVNDPIAREFHLVCSPEWYDRAIKFALAKKSAPKIYIFSDHLEWAKQRYSYLKNVVFVESSQTPAIDMLKMSCFKRIVISNSSFSWWASYIGKSNEVIAPTHWFNGISTKSLPIYVNKWHLRD